MVNMADNPKSTLSIARDTGRGRRSCLTGDRGRGPASIRTRSRAFAAVGRRRRGPQALRDRRPLDRGQELGELGVEAGEHLRMHDLPGVRPDHLRRDRDSVVVVRLVPPGQDLIVSGRPICLAGRHSGSVPAAPARPGFTASRALPTPGARSPGAPLISVPKGWCPPSGRGSRRRAPPSPVWRRTGGKWPRRTEVGVTSFADPAGVTRPELRVAGRSAYPPRQLSRGRSAARC